MVTQDYSSQASFYDDMMPKLAEDSPEIVTYAKFLENAATVIEFGCGTGRISLPLVRHLLDRGGLSYYLGTDLSPDMAAIAQAKAEAVGSSNGGTRVLEFEVADAAADHSSLKSGYFDAGIAFCGLISLLGKDRLEAFFSNAYAALAPGGRLFVDALHPEVTKATAPIMDGSYMRVSETSGLASFTKVEGDRYDADFVWISGETAHRFSEQSELIPTELLDRIATSVGFEPRLDLAGDLAREVGAINGPVMSFSAYIKRP